MSVKDTNRDYFLLFSQKGGKGVLSDINRQVGGRLLVKGKDGMTDAHGMAYRCGQRDLLEYILERIEDGKMAR